MEEIGKKYEIYMKKWREHRATIMPERVNSPTEFFFNAYQEAKLQLREIVMASAQIEKNEEKLFSAKKKIELLHKYPNNVIAFCAERGCGKTTAMLSFSNALEALDGPPNNNNAAKAFWGTISRDDDPLNVRFIVMPPIDPSSMENSESVLQQIISQLFEDFCKEVKRNLNEYGSDRKHDKFDTIADKFQKCAQAIDSLYKAPENRTSLIEDELDQIAEIGQSAGLLLLLHELIDQYLTLICGKDTKCCLVVQIDDADMDIGRSYQILEDVRKYLSLPRVIVLMATNIQQLETTVEQHFLQEYKQGLKHSGSMITVGRCHAIAVLYLEKAIPHTRRIYLPDIDETIRQHLSNLSVSYQDEAGKELMPEGTYQKQLLNLLYQKTGMVFTFERDYLHNLLPSHMRELSQFLSFFTSMDDLREDCTPDSNEPDGYEIAVNAFIQQGFSKFKEDTLQFLDRWEKNALENAQPALVWDEADCRDEFARACEQQGIDLQSYLGDAQNKPHEISVSYADVMGMLDILTDLPGANRQYKFAYAIRLFYSIRMHTILIQEIRALGSSTSTNNTENMNQNIDFRTLTDFLQDTLLKRGPVNDTTHTPFGCWIIEMPVQWFQSSSSLQLNTPYEIPFLRYKYQGNHTIRTFSTIAPNGFFGVWRSVPTPVGQRDPDIVVFSPLYPLLAALDRFIRYQKTDMLLQDINDAQSHMSQIYIALLVCLNWDVQRILFKIVKNQAGTLVWKMADELYRRHIPKLSAYVPKKAPSWLLPDCFQSEVTKARHSIFDVMTIRLHPVPEYKDYIRTANNEIAVFTEAFSQLDASEKSTDIKSLWKENDSTTNQMDKALTGIDTAVQNILSSSSVASRRIIEETSPSKFRSLHILLTDYLHYLNSGNNNNHENDNSPSFTLKESSLTPRQIENALTNYKELLEQLAQRGADSMNGNSSKVSLKQQKSGYLSKESLSDDPITVNDREAVAKTLQGLIQFGQQLLNILDSQQNETQTKPES